MHPLMVFTRNQAIFLLIPVVVNARLGRSNLPDPNIYLGFGKNRHVQQTEVLKGNYLAGKTGVQFSMGQPKVGKT
jgi:hypothetical protein